MTCTGILLVVLISACHHRPSGKATVLYTTPRGYADGMGQALYNISVNAESWPLIETLIPSEHPGMEQFMQHIDTYDWVVFSSRKAIESFHQYAEIHEVPDDKIRKVKFCAIGKDIRFMQKTLHMEPALIPEEPSPAGIVQALKNLNEDLRQKKIAVLAPDVIGITEPNVVPNFLNDLRLLGMDVDKIDAYTTQAVTISADLEKVDAILNGNYSIIAFTSTAEVEVFLKIMKGKKLPPDIKLACFGPYTAENARNLGLNIDIVASDFSSFDGFAREIEMHLSTMKHQ
jgi:uroporphyrinogen-III synthase